MSNLELAAAAWAAVRNSDDALWNILPIGIKAKLADLAGKYRNGAKVYEGDYPPEGFAEKVFELASRQEFFAVGNGDGSGPELVSMGVGEVQSAEHEDTHVPSPIPEDVDPLKSDLNESAAPTEFDDAGADTPVEPEPLTGKLPADFPSHDLLHDAGINTYSQLFKQRNSEEGLKGIVGIGPVTAAKIEEELGK